MFLCGLLFGKARGWGREDLQVGRAEYVVSPGARQMRPDGVLRTIGRCACVSIPSGAAVSFLSCLFFRNADAAVPIFVFVFLCFVFFFLFFGSWFKSRIACDCECQQEWWRKGKGGEGKGRRGKERKGKEEGVFVFGLDE